MPYLLRFKLRVGFALSCLVGAKVANLIVPILLKSLIDAMTIPPGVQMILVVPVTLIVAYGLLRLMASVFTMNLSDMTKI